ITELAAFIDRARYVRGAVARDATRERELLEQPLHACGIAWHRRVELAIAALQPGVGHQRRTTVPGADDRNHVQVASQNHPVQVRVDEIQSRRRTPMAEQAWFDMVQSQGLGEERVVEEID